MPQGIQRQRTRGWKMPENARYIGRPGKFGNPYEVNRFGLALSLGLFSETAQGSWNPTLLAGMADTDVRDAYLLHCAWMKRMGRHHPAEVIRSELRGFDLACWCPLPKPGERDLCHREILLAIANIANA